MTSRPPTALIAEDEPLLRKSLVRLLGQAWPSLEIVAEARSGREALALFESHHPDVCFLDVHMPGLSGVEVACRIGPRSRVVFVTAFDRYAVEAFEQGAVDYLVKPVEPARLARTVSRLQEQLQASRPIPALGPLLDFLKERMAAVHGQPSAPARLRWFKVSSGRSVRMVPAEEVDFLRSEDKYTLVAWRDSEGSLGEGLVRTTLKEILLQLDPEQFVQVHRSAVVNLRAVSHLTRDTKETGILHLKHRRETLPVSRTFLHQFHHM